jgi:tripartite-type tricarboxylate transporter receptor subunit TctC
MLQLAVPPEAVITGAEKTVYLPTLAGSGGRQGYEWLIKAKPGTTVTLKAASPKAGTDTATVTLK